jgi:hypothetical protein
MLTAAQILLSAVAQGRQVPVEGNRNHVDQGADMAYRNRPDLRDQACLGQLQQAYATAPKSQRYGVVKIAVAPWSDMDQPDLPRILAFYRAHVDRGPEDAL